MKKILGNAIEKIKTKRYMHYIFIIIIGLLISIPFFWMQIFYTDDGKFHLLRLIGLDYSIEGGSSFPFLVFPFFCKNWGYSMMTFYPQLVTYIPYILGIIAGSFAIGLKIFAPLTVILSGIFMYNFINEVTKNKGIAFLSAIFYMIFPYRFECLFNRYSIGEFTAFVFIPIVFQGLYNLIHGDKKRHYYIAIGAIGLMLSHTISTLYTAFFCLIYILFNLKSFFKKDVIIKCVINVIFILLVTALLLIPMLEFKMSADYSILEPGVMRTAPENVSEKTIKPWQFLKDKEYDENGVSFVLGIPFITFLFLGLLAYQKMDKKYRDFYITNIILGIISLYMCTNLFLWDFMPGFMCTVQYPWRLLGFACFFLTPICGINFYYIMKYISKDWLRTIAYIIVFVIIGIFTVSTLSRYKETDTSKDEWYEQSIYANPQINYFSINRDNLPLKALLQQREYLIERDDKVKVVSGNADILNENKYGLELSFNIANVSKDTNLELPYFFYPGYTITLKYDNQEIELEVFESEYGFLQIQIPEDIEEGKINVKYTATVLDKTAYAISGISLISFIVYIFWYRKRYNQKLKNN